MTTPNAIETKAVKAVLKQAGYLKSRVWHAHPNLRVQVNSKTPNMPHHDHPAYGSYFPGRCSACQSRETQINELRALIHQNSRLGKFTNLIVELN